MKLNHFHNGRCLILVAMTKMFCGNTFSRQGIEPNDIAISGYFTGAQTLKIINILKEMLGAKQFCIPPFSLECSQKLIGSFSRKTTINENRVEGGTSLRNSAPNQFLEDPNQKLSNLIPKIHNSLNCQMSIRSDRKVHGHKTHTKRFKNCYVNRKP